MTSATPAKQWCSPAQRMSGLAGAGLTVNGMTTPASFFSNWPQAYSSQPVADAPALPPVQPTACGDLLPAAGRSFLFSCVVFPEFKESSHRVSVPRIGRRSRAVRFCSAASEKTDDFCPALKRQAAGGDPDDSRATNHRGLHHVRCRNRRNRRAQHGRALPLLVSGLSTFDGQAGGVCHRHSGVIHREMAARRNAAIRLSLCPADWHVRHSADCRVDPVRRLGAGGCA